MSLPKVLNKIETGLSGKIPHGMPMTTFGQQRLPATYNGMPTITKEAKRSFNAGQFFAINNAQSVADGLLYGAAAGAAGIGLGVGLGALANRD